MLKSVKLGIDFGITNTDVVIDDGVDFKFKTFSSKNTSVTFLKELISSCTDDVTKLQIIGVTGGKHDTLGSSYEGIEIKHYNEVDAIVKGAIKTFRPKEEKFMVISLGSGSACAIFNEGNIFHAGGTGLGGGTIRGLSKLIFGEDDPIIINSLSSKGKREKVDLLLKDVISGPIGNLPESASAVNFGKIDYSECTKEDLAAGIISMVGQTILKTAITIASINDIKKVYVIGRSYKYDLLREMLIDGFGIINIKPFFHKNGEYAICTGTV
tara:strand:- start:86 stop:892 length:807 start_codon:yes stop_codon:yes gene_type:complete